MAMDEQALYDKLSRLVMEDGQLRRFGYPESDLSVAGLCLPPKGKRFHSDFLNRTFECRRCKAIFKVDSDGVPPAVQCHYHSGALGYQGEYACCKGDSMSRGCRSNWCHTHTGELELEYNRGFKETRSKAELGEDNKHGIYALDCEMCSTVYGYQLTRVTVMNHREQVVYNKLVRPTHRVLDYNTIFSGISERDLKNVTLTLSDVQSELLELFSDKTILIGHALHLDLRALKLFHKRVIDTLQLYPHHRGFPYKMNLKRLASEYLRENIQTGGRGHDSEEDARTALRLAIRRAG